MDLVVFLREPPLVSGVENCAALVGWAGRRSEWLEALLKDVRGRVVQSDGEPIFEGPGNVRHPGGPSRLALVEPTRIRIALKLFGFWWMEVRFRLIGATRVDVATVVGLGDPGRGERPIHSELSGHAGLASEQAVRHYLRARMGLVASEYRLPEPTDNWGEWLMDDRVIQAGLTPSLGPMEFPLGAAIVSLWWVIQPDGSRELRQFGMRPSRLTTVV